MSEALSYHRQDYAKPPQAFRLALKLFSLCRFPSVYLFRYENMRNECFKSFREDLKEHSR